MDTTLTPDEKHIALFAQMVMQSASMALVFMGRTPNPVTGKTEKDLDAARLFIEQLEMLEVKTKGNLTQDEQRLLNQNLMTIRMAFVEAVKEAPANPQITETKPEASEPGPVAPEADDASKKRFSKSYGAS